MPKVYPDGRRGGGRPTLPLDVILTTRTELQGECLVWTGQKDRRGYGRLKHNGRDLLAHRVAYELAKGRIPKGLQIDHLCRNTSCVNPSHLEAVTLPENNRRSNSFSAVNARKTHCIHGHEFTPENTFLEDGHKRKCRQCWADRRAPAPLPHPPHPDPATNGSAQ